MSNAFRYTSFVFFASVVFLLGACSGPPDEVITKEIMQMKTDAESLKWEAAADHISNHYKDSNGNNSLIIRNIIKSYMSGLQSLEAEVKVKNVSVNGGEAKAQVELIVRAKKDGKIYFAVGGEDMPEYPVVWFKKERFSWKIVKVEGIGQSQESPW